MIGEFWSAEGRILMNQNRQYSSFVTPHSSIIPQSKSAIVII